MTETRFYEPARLSTQPKPLFLLTPLDAQAGWGHCYLSLPCERLARASIVLNCTMGLFGDEYFEPLFSNFQRNVGSLSNDDKDGRENVAAKMTLPIKLSRVYVDPLNLPNQGDFSWIWIHKDFIQVLEKKRKFVVVCSPPALNVALWRFT